MHIKKIKNRSGSINVIVGVKNRGKFKRLATMGVSSDEDEVSALVQRGHAWIAEQQERPFLPMLHAVPPQDLQIQSLLVGVELLVLLEGHNVSSICGCKGAKKLGEMRIR